MFILISHQGRFNSEFSSTEKISALKSFQHFRQFDAYFKILEPIKTFQLKKNWNPPAGGAAVMKKSCDEKTQMKASKRKNCVKNSTNYFAIDLDEN